MVASAPALAALFLRGAHGVVLGGHCPALSHPRKLAERLEGYRTHSG